MSVGVCVALNAIYPGQRSVHSQNLSTTILQCYINSRHQIYFHSQKFQNMVKPESKVHVFFQITEGHYLGTRDQ